MGTKKFSKDEEIKLFRMLSCFHECEIIKPVVDKVIELRKSGSIKIPDAIIAAGAIIHDAKLITRNVSDFKDVMELKVLNPFDK